MNIVYVNSHDTGRFVSPYGYDMPTPIIQSLAEQGLTFRRAFAASPTCSPSRAALLTGQYPHQCGMFGLAHHGWSLDNYQRHPAAKLARHGYDTALAGFQHVAHRRSFPLSDVGYTHLLNHDHDGEYDEPATTDAAVAFLDSRSDSDRPFYLEVGLFETHRDNTGERLRFTRRQHEPADPRYVRPPDSLPDLPTVRQDWANFRQAAALLDGQVGRLLDALDRNGLADDTLVVLTTDHGAPLPRMKATLSEQGLGVMLVMRGPANSSFSGGRVVDALVSHVDLYPTLYEVAGVAAPAGHEGLSLLPMLAGEAAPSRTHVFGEMNHHVAATAPQRSVRGERFKYVKLYPPTPAHLREWPWQADDGPTAEAMAGLDDREPNLEQLYDLHLDPNEQYNLIGEAGHSEAADDLRRQLGAWMLRTNDPLCSGAIPAQSA